MYVYPPQSMPARTYFLLFTLSMWPLPLATATGAAAGASTCSNFPLLTSNCCKFFAFSSIIMLEKLLISEFSLSSTDCSYTACWLSAGAGGTTTSCCTAATAVVAGAAASLLPLLLLGEPPLELLPLPVPLLLLLSVSLAADAVLVSLDSCREVGERIS